MLGINKFKRSVITFARSLKNLEGQEVTLNAGEHVNLLALTSGLFAIQNKAKGTVVLPQGLFANNFKLFEKEI
jgi:hypothetical protein